MKSADEQNTTIHKPQEPGRKEKGKLSLVGYGLRISPHHPGSAWKAPFDDPPGWPAQLHILHHGPHGSRQMLVNPPGVGHVLVENLGTAEARVRTREQPGTRPTPVMLRGTLPDQVAAMDESDREERDWWIETAGYRMVWPDEYYLSTTPGGADWPFELRGPYKEGSRSLQDMERSAPENGLIILRGPWPRGTHPDLSYLLKPGQVKLADQEGEDVKWLDARVPGERGPTFQRNVVVSRHPSEEIALTCQGPMEKAKPIRSACQQIVDSLVPKRQQ